MRINYTTYDIRRCQDVVHPLTSHCDVMLLNNAAQPMAHPSWYCYARVLGIFHANVLYVGPGMVDYQPHCMQLLWVRWFRSMPSSSGWSARWLDALDFPPIYDENSFGFIDPTDVMRGCHIVPAFSRGRRHRDGIGLSLCAKDSTDWAAYYVNRWVCLPLQID